MNHYHHAKAIVSKLSREGFIAYFAGGWVRDFVMGHPSEDIDIATNASPIQIMDLFPNTILVGLAFGVVIVVIEGHTFEVASFRKDVSYQDGRRPDAIILSTPQEDASRRDFTINGMFYDPLNEEIHDFVHGQKDIKLGIIRTIGDPSERFFEDRLRMLRAFRFAARFGFTIDPDTLEAIREYASRLLPAVAMERIYQEFKKMAAYPRFDEALVEMHQLGLLEAIFPELQHTHLKDLRHYVSSFKNFPKECHPIFYLLQLFPDKTVGEKLEIGRRLRASNKELSEVEFADKVANFLNRVANNQSVDRFDWTLLMAQPNFHKTVEILTASYPNEERESLRVHLERKEEELRPHLLRHRAKKPIITSEELMSLGIRPGKQMGDLLRLAEKSAVNENILDKQVILEKLQRSNLWSP